MDKAARPRFARGDPGILRKQEGREAGEDIGQNGSRRFAREVRIAGFPVEAFQMIGENGSADCGAGRQEDFKGVAFDLGCDWAKDGHAGFLIVGLWAHDQRRTAT